MHVLITGAAGFVGQRLLAALLAQGSVGPSGGAAQAVTRIDCLDVSAGALQHENVHYHVGDIGDAAVLEPLITADTGLIFHLAAVVSGSAEADFDLGMRANLQGMMNLLAQARAVGHKPTVVFSSSIAVFGGELPALITDATTPMPQGSYGVQKLIGEQLIQDYSRKGFINGCSLRLPAVLVRPGAPNGAASGFSSSIIREPLAGREMVLPVPESTPMWSASPDVCVANLLHAASLPQSAWGTNRSVNLPGLVVTMNEALAALETLGGAELRAKVRVALDPAITALVDTWAAHFETPRALAMGFARDADFLAMVRAYIRDNPQAIKVAIRPDAI